MKGLTKNGENTMPIRIAILSSSMILFIFAIHWLFFKSMGAFFHVERFIPRILPWAAAAILTGIVISAFVLARSSDGWWVTGYYRFAAVWIGFLVHLLTAAAAAWLIIGVFHLLRFPAERGTVAGVLLVAACIFSIYGIYNAFSPRVREVPVHLSDVPAAWEDAPIVFLSDIHLGRMHGRRFAESLVSRVNALDPKIVFITGDIFDGLGGDHWLLADSLDGIRAEKGVYYVSGNHEDYIGKKQAHRLLEESPMIRLDNEMAAIDGLEIVGISYPGIDSPDSIAGLPERGNDTSSVRLLLFHTPTSIITARGDSVDRHFSTYWMPDTSFRHNREAGIDLQLSGHTHYGQIFPLNLLTRLLYRGYDYGLKQSGNMYVYTTSGAGTWGPPMRTAGISEIAVIRLRQKP